jgi:2-iminobutanoate/2-iminopropanoate deaminase
MRSLAPPSIYPPFAKYSHGVEIPVGSRLVFCSGQLGIDLQGVIPEGVEAQARLCFQAIAAILGEAAMTLEDLVRINAFVVGAEHLAGYMKVRDEFVGNRRPASTLMIVQGFARPDFKVEVEAVAAQAPQAA